MFRWQDKMTHVLMMMAHTYTSPRAIIVLDGIGEILRVSKSKTDFKLNLLSFVSNIGHKEPQEYATGIVGSFIKEARL